VLEVNGHDISQILTALDNADRTSEKPTVIIAHTIKGKGVPSFEGRVHFAVMTDEMYAEAMTALK